MGMLSSVIDGIEDGLYTLTKNALMTEAPSYIRPETAIGGNYDPRNELNNAPPDVIVTKNGEMLTVFRIEGTKNVMPDTFRHQGLIEYYDNAARMLLPFMKRKGHAVEVVLERDPDKTRGQLTKLLQPSSRVAKNLGMDFSEILQGRLDTMSKHCTYERSWLVISTSMSALNEAEIKLGIMENAARATKEGYIPPREGFTNFFVINKQVHSRHKSFEMSFAKAMDSAGLVLTKLSAHEALTDAKICMDPKGTSEAWKPTLPGDPIRPIMDRKGNPTRHLPNIASQIVPSNLKTDGDYVIASGMHYLSGCMKKCPMDTESFTQLFDRVPKNVPFRINMRLYPDGLKIHSLKMGINNIIAFVSEACRMIKLSYEDLKESEASGDAVVAMDVHFQSWATSKDVAEMNFSLLDQAVQAWGITDTSKQFGDPYLGFFPNIPFISDKNIAPKMLQPISEATKMLPFTRPASPWKHGSALLRTLCGKVFPMQPGSPIQDTWIDLFFSPPGSGKSVSMNVLNLAGILGTAGKDLPYMFILDIGVSSRGLIDLISSMLPLHERLFAQYKRMQNTVDWAVNPFDTDEGMRYPSAVRKAYQKSLLITFCTPTGRLDPYPGVDSLAETVIELAYKHFSPEGNPKKYQERIDPIVDAALEEMRLQGMEVEDEPSWWEVTDFFWKHGKIRESQLAQRFAMPILSDLPAIVNTPEVRQIFAKPGSEIRIDTNELLIDAFTRLITEAIKMYPVFSNTTRLDLGQVRILALDLQDVAPEGGAAEKKQSALFYMFAKFLFAKMCFIKKEVVETWVRDLKRLPNMYHDYHFDRADEMDRHLKTLAIDELHRSSAIPEFRASVNRDIREGRKWKLRIALASQYMEDFDSEMIDAATSIYVMKYVDDANTKRLKDRLGFSDSALRKFKEKCNGPVPGFGAPFLVRFKTKVGQLDQILVNTISPQEDWGLNSSQEDRWIKSYVFDAVGPQMGLRKLARRYPQGSARSDYHKRLEKMGQSLDDDDQDDNVLRTIAIEVIEQIEDVLA